MRSQSMAEIKPLPVSENGRPPYWNSISSFDFDLRIVIGMPFCICLPNFVVIGRSSVVLWRHIRLFKMAALSHIEFDLGNSWVISAIVGPSLFLKFGLDPIYSFGDIAIFIFCCFGLKLPIHANFLGRGWGHIPSNITYRSNFEKPSLRGNTSFESWSVKIGPAVWPGRRIEEKVRTGQSKKSQGGG